MSLSNSFYDAIKTGNLIRIRIMMKNSLIGDCTFSEFDEMEKTASSMQGLYDDHDGEEFEAENSWNDDYLNKLLVRVVSNFSHERIDHIKKVIRYLNPIEEEKHSDKNNNIISVRFGKKIIVLGIVLITILSGVIACIKHVSFFGVTLIVLCEIVVGGLFTAFIFNWERKHEKRN